MSASPFPVRPFRFGVQLSATIDVLSEGRVEIGLGAGWMISDYDGLPKPVQAGDRVDQIEMNIRTFFNSVTVDRAGTIDSIARAIGVDPTVLESAPYTLVGTPSKIVEDVRALRETYGFSYITVGVNEIDSFAPVVAELAGI